MRRLSSYFRRSVATWLVALGSLPALSPLAIAQPQDPRFESQEEAVRFTFARYRNAVLVRDGATAHATVDANTRAYYDRLIDLIKYGTQEELSGESYTDLTIILSSRQFIPADTLAGMDGRGLFVHAIERGWTDREMVVAGVGPIEFREEVAYGRATRSGLHTLFHWVFRFEDDRWRLDLAEQMRTIDAASREMLRSEGLSPADLAYAMLVRGAGPDVVSPAIWHPPFTRD